MPTDTNHSDRDVSPDPVRDVHSYAGSDRFTSAAAALQLGKSAVDALVESLACGVLLADADGRVVFANAEARRLPSELREELQWAVTRAILTEEQVHEDALELRGPDGRPRCLVLDVVPVRGTEGVCAAVMTVADVTANARLAQWEPVMESLARL